MATREDVSIFLLIFIAFMFPAFVLSMPTDGALQQSDEQNIQEFSRYFSKPFVKSPLKTFAQTPLKLYVYYKAAEHALNTCGRTTKKMLRLRRILDLKAVGNDSVVWFHLLFQEEIGNLEEAFTSVHVRQDPGSKVKFSVRKFSVKGIEDGTNSLQESCDELSKLANCIKCEFRGICDKGTAQISAWLAFALKTQRVLQMDIPINQVQMISAHNAFNNRADGYGLLDGCPWPPPYKQTCLNLANQEFSFTDLLDMGVRGMEIDPWWCFGKMLMSHNNGKAYRGCAPWDREFEDGIQEIGKWLHQPENSHEVIRLYFEDGWEHTQGHDDLINDAIAKYFGDKVLTPSESEKYFANQWPTARDMLKLNKTVFIAAAGSTHGGKFIYPRFWKAFTRNEFMSHKNCGELKPGDSSRVYSDSTKYGPFWDGPEKTGVILDFSRFLKCGVTYPAADQVNPRLLSTAVFTWADGQPAGSLTPKSCVILNGRDERWHVGVCTEKHKFACVSTNDGNNWRVSKTSGQYSSPSCPSGFEFSVAHNGYQHQKLVEAAKGMDVWLNFAPYMSLMSGNV